jgi:hypothetical protein
MRNAESFYRIPLLHMHGQPSWHDDAFIVGNREALLMLRQAIDKALETSTGEMQPFVSDGEGYDMHVYLETDPEYWDEASFPYDPDETNIPDDPKRISPYDLYKKRRGE